MTEHLTLSSIDAWLTIQWLGRRWLAKGVTCLRLRSPGQIDIKVSVAAWSHDHTSTSTALPFLPSLFLLFAAFKSFESNRVSRSVVPRLFFVLQQSKLPRFATSSLLILSFIISDSLLQISNQTSLPNFYTLNRLPSRHFKHLNLNLKSNQPYIIPHGSWRL
jgi:hypothetical protein